MGQPSSDGVFRSAWFPATSSIFCAAPQAEKCGPAATAAAAAANTKSAVAPTRITLLFDVSRLTIGLLLLVVHLFDPDEARRTLLPGLRWRQASARGLASRHTGMLGSLTRPLR